MNGRVALIENQSYDAFREPPKNNRKSVSKSRITVAIHDSKVKQSHLDDETER